MFNGQTKFKQIQGLDAILNQHTSQIGTLNTEMGNIALGIPSLTGNVLSIPFTGPNGIPYTKTVDLQSLAVDINIASASIDANTYKITITETDGTTYEVPLKSIIDKYFNDYIKPLIDAKADKSVVEALQTEVTALEAELAKKATQAALDLIVTRVSTVETVAANAKATAESALTTAQAADQKAIAAQTTANTAKATADSATSAAQSADQKAQSALNALVPVETALTTAVADIADLKTKVVSGINVLELVGIGTTNDGDPASNTELPAGIKHIVAVSVGGQAISFGNKARAAYFSKDNGATAISNGDYTNAKIHWNHSVIDYNIASDDQIVVTVIV